MFLFLLFLYVKKIIQMENKQCWSPIIILLILSSCLIAQISGTQTEKLDSLFAAKYGRNSEIDTSHFHARNLRGIGNGHETQVYSQKGMKDKDRIERLPGQPHVGFEQYGGYVTIDKSAGRAFYYYFVEAHHSNNSLPLLLWLNGGPGCSSIAYGAMEELGPFRVHSDGKTLYKNRFSWNYAANVLFLESPAGVGFSYSNRSKDYDTNGDRKTAKDNYVFLLNWLERFPEYKNRDFYLSGESYAGHYVPQLAHTILYHNKKAKKTLINLKGIIIGNAVIHDETDIRGMYDYFSNHALISPESAYHIKKHCDFTSGGKSLSDKCNEALSNVDRNTYFIDIYSIYAPLCKSSNLTVKPRWTTGFDPCNDHYVFAYMNSPEVQKALHANVTKLKYDWEPCSNVISSWVDSPSTIIPLLKEFIANKLRVWIYSGDTDGRVPFTSTVYSINEMNLTVKTPWHPWFLNGEVGGYTQVYKGDLTFATVRGAGHEVPSFEPARAFSLIKHFLDGTPLPDTTRYMQ